MRLSRIEKADRRTRASSSSMSPVRYLVGIASFLANAACIAQTSGSGFFVTPTGLVVTNYHVIEDALKIEVISSNGKRIPATVLRADKANDLAILQTGEHNTPFFYVSSSSNVRRGEKIYALGFPQTSIQGIEPKLTDGIVSSISGIRDDPRTFQITNAIQPGNSGGPLFAEDGTIVGVVVATLNSSKVLAVTGSIPQNVNYAIKSNYLLELVGSIGSVRLPQPNAKSSRSGRKLVDVIADAEKALVRVIATEEQSTFASPAPRARPPRANTEPLDAELVRIGHVAPMSGGQAHYGKDNENGVRMAIEELNTQNIVIGGKNIKFEMVGGDDAADPKQGTAVAQKLCEAKVSGVVGHLNSGTTIPASKIYNDCGIPHVTGAATNPNLTKPGYKTTYRIIANDNALGAGLAFFAADALRLRRVAIVDDRTAYGQGVADTFRRTAQSKGIQVVDEQFVTDKTIDFLTALTSIKSKGADAIFYGGMDAQAGAMLRQMDQLGMSNVKMFGGDGICTAELSRIAAGARSLDGVVCAEGGTSLAKMPGGYAWKAKYDAKYPGQFQVYSPYTYDATFVLVEAMKRADSTDPKVYTAKLAETAYKGVTTTISFEPNGELKNPPITLYVYKDGKKVALN